MNWQASDLPDEVPPRRFEFAADGSYKFWAIELSGNRIAVRYGKVGSTGQTREIELASVPTAKREYAKRIRQKTSQGYREKKPPEKKVITSEQIWDSLQEHEPFLQAILRDPDDSLGYSIYADWLLERGDPLGTFTNLQVALGDPELPLYQRAKLEKEAQRLQVIHARRWLGSLAKWLMDASHPNYGYRFVQGQLGAIVCQTMELEFAVELRRSPHCRMLRELTIVDTESLDSPVEFEGRTFAAGRRHGLEPLLQANFSNLRDFRAGVDEHEVFGQRGHVGSPQDIIELIKCMPRLETLYLHAPVSWDQLFQIPLTNLRTLHVDLPPERIHLLIESGWLTQLHTLGIFSQLDDRAVEQLIAAPGFRDLAEFVTPSSSRTTERFTKMLKATDVLISFKNMIYSEA